MVNFITQIYDIINSGLLVLLGYEKYLNNYSQFFFSNGFFFFFFFFWEIFPTLEFDPKLSVHGYCGVLRSPLCPVPLPRINQHPPAHHLLDAPYDLVGVVDELQLS
jgi:hypothetical protein